MSRLAIFGATGALGSRVASHAVRSGHEVSVLVRTPAKLPPEVSAKARVQTGDLTALEPASLARFIEGNEVLINCAGLVSEGQAFVDLFDRVVSAVEAVSPATRPVCWFLAGAALLDLGADGRRGVDLPKVRDVYWPHRVNFERLQRSGLDWRLLCPGPMVDQEALGIERLRVSLERLPVELPAFAKALPGPLILPFFAAKVPEMIIPYADAAALMLSNIAIGSPMSRKRVGVALPAGMRGRKDHWVAKQRT
jgi:putative NADH-flavin reductase